MDFRERYLAAGHRLQSALKLEMEALSAAGRLQSSQFSPKHMRVGIDLRAADALGLCRLLITKGVITADEYLEAMAEAAEHEAQTQIERIRAELGLPDAMDFA